MAPIEYAPYFFDPPKLDEYILVLGESIIEELGQAVSTLENDSISVELTVNGLIQDSSSSCMINGACPIVLTGDNQLVISATDIAFE